MPAVFLGGFPGISLENTGKIERIFVSLPDLQTWEEDVDRKNRIHCNYLMGLGYKGLEDAAHAENHFRKVLKQDPSHAGAMEHKNS